VAKASCCVRAHAILVHAAGILLASSMMLRHIRQPSAANRLDLALYNVLQVPLDTAP